MRTVVIRVLPHPQFKDDWLVECRELLPCGLWYKSKDNALSYAELLGKDSSGEIRVLTRDGGTESVIVLLGSVPGES